MTSSRRHRRQASASDAGPIYVDENSFIACSHCDDKFCLAGRNLAIIQIKRRWQMAERERCSQVLEEGLLGFANLVKPEKRDEACDKFVRLLQRVALAERSDDP